MDNPEDPLRGQMQEAAMSTVEALLQKTDEAQQRIIQITQNLRMSADELRSDKTLASIARNINAGYAACATLGRKHESGELDTDRYLEQMRLVALKILTLQQGLFAGIQVKIKRTAESN